MKKVIIIGGTGGLGSKISESLKTNFEVISLGSKEIDITKYDECHNLFQKIDCDILINFAGINYDSFIHKICEDNLPDINKMVNVNINGTINLVSTALKKMRERNHGRIILISSVLAEKEIHGTGVYSSCKSFIDKFVKSVSLENTKFGITANSIQLGYFDAGMTYKISPNMLESIKESIGLKRFGTIEELSNVIKFLIDTEYVTGVNIKINGGL